MLKLSRKKAIQERADKNLRKFLRELDAQTPDDFDDIFGERHYYSNLSEKLRIARMLDEYDERKEKARRQLSSLLREIGLEQKNGFKNLSSQERQVLNEKRRYEAEAIVMQAGLGREDSGELLVPVVYRIYQRKKFYNPQGYKH